MLLEIQQVFSLFLSPAMMPLFGVKLQTAMTAAGYGVPFASGMAGLIVFLYVLSALLDYLSSGRCPASARRRDSAGKSGSHRRDAGGTPGAPPRNS